MLNTIESMMTDAEAEAGRGCGLSDVLYERICQDLYADILSRAPQEERAEVEKILRQRGYDPDFVPFQAGPDECSLTGIDTNCCPCGRHP